MFLAERAIRAGKKQLRIRRLRAIRKVDLNRLVAARVDPEQRAHQRWIAPRHELPALPKSLLLDIFGLPAFRKSVEAPARAVGQRLASCQPPIRRYVRRQPNKLQI